MSATLRAEPRLSILIVNYNGGALLDRCLQSLRDAAPACAVETILVDNASADGSGERAAKDFPEVHVVRNAENVGLSNPNVLVCRAAATIRVVGCAP